MPERLIRRARLNDAQVMAVVVCSAPMVAVALRHGGWTWLSVLFWPTLAVLFNLATGGDDA